MPRRKQIGHKTKRPRTGAQIVADEKLALAAVKKAGKNQSKAKGDK